MARTPQDPQIRMTEILDTAEYLFSVKGYRGTTISDIAQKMNVAQGMFYYYFKSKEEILEALLNRHISSFVAEISDMASSDSITPIKKIELFVSLSLHNILSKNRVLFDTLYDDQNLHMKDKLTRQVKGLLTPWLLKIIEEGVRMDSFHISDPRTTVDFILIIIEPLFDALYEKMPDGPLSHRVRMAEALIEKALGAQEATLRIPL